MRADRVLHPTIASALLGVSLMALSSGAAVAQTVQTAPGQTEAPIEETDDGIAADGLAITLDTVVVTAAGFEQSVADAPASVSVVTREDLDRGQFRDLTDALRNVQGVSVTGVANERDISIRGLPGQYTLILVDGVRQGTRDSRVNGSAGFEQSFIPPLNAIERIEVLRGPASTLYGSDAVGGVINIITRAVASEPSGSVTIEGTAQGSGRHGNSGQVQLYASTPLMEDILGLQVWSRGYKRGEDRLIAGDTEREEGDLTARLTYAPNLDHRFFLEGGMTRLEQTATAGRTQAEGTLGRIQDNDRDHLRANYDGVFGWGDVTASLQREWGERTYRNEDRISGAFIENPRSPEIVNTVGDLKTVVPFDAFGGHRLSLGTQYIKNELTDQNPGRRTGEDEEFSLYQYAFFLEDEWQVTDTFALTGGVRMDYHEVYEENFAPRLYGVWRPFDMWTFKGGVSTGFRAPDIRSITPDYAYTTGGGGCFYGPAEQLGGRNPCGVIVSNEDLDPETSTNFEAAVLFDDLAGLTAGATFFYTDFKDKIANDRVYNADGSFARWDLDPNYTLFRVFNIESAIIQGVELTLGFQATDTISVLGSYTYTDSEQQGGEYDGLALTRTPEHTANVRVDWLTPIEGLTAFAAGFYEGEQINAGLRIGSNGDPVRNKDGDVVARRYDGYFTADIGASYQINENFTLNGTIYNLFDEEVLPDDYNTVVEGRRFWASLNASF
ncbi:TonB-dependent receptor domain-containing protein [Aureimonas mangrovi]|uniref:TonB-dependent receptor domain-containing protein n=1 Tax=Aureimonas mangrovi TaxID=2758041 RepID=UPI00163D6CE9|nr:TonB-dependent receptor [Aureimonas mangrovi]